MLALPRRWAPLPLIMGACYVTLGPAIRVGPFWFPFIRLLILVACVRILTRRVRLAGGVLRLDCIMLLWGAWAIWRIGRISCNFALGGRAGMSHNGFFCQHLWWGERVAGSREAGFGERFEFFAGRVLPGAWHFRRCPKEIFDRIYRILQDWCLSRHVREDLLPPEPE
jgi:hypothetical protein